MNHPEDYTIQDTPIEPSLVFNERNGHVRLVLRISWKTDSKYMPMTFIVDSGAMESIYFCKTARCYREATWQVLWYCTRLMDQHAVCALTTRRNGMSPQTLSACGFCSGSGCQ
jgi:hypothetical protein